MQPLSRQGLAGQALECEEWTDGTEGEDWAGPFEAWFPLWIVPSRGYEREARWKQLR